MKKMKKKWNESGILVVVLLTGLLAGGCNAGKKMETSGEPIILNETQQREYNYALTEATKQKLFGNFKQAAALYMKCIEVNPASDAAYFELSGIYMLGRDLKTAKALNLKASRLDPDNYWYKIQLAQLYLMTEATDSAVAVYEDILSRWPDKMEIKYELSRVYSETGKSSRALKILNEIEKENGISEPVTMLKEQIYVKEKKFDQAINELNAIIKAAPEEIRYLGILAELYTSLDRKEEAKETYKKIFEIEPDNGIAQLSMAEFYRIENNREKQFEFLAIAFRNKSLPLDRKMTVIIEFLTNEALFKENKKEIDSLIQILMEVNPDDYRVKTARADYLSKVERYEDAIKVYDDVLTEQKGNYFIWEQAIFIENILGNTDQVYNRCTEALKYFQDKPFLYLFLGNAAMQKGKNEEAVSSLEKGLECIGKNIPLTVQFYAFLAEAWRNLGDYKKSDEYFEKALQMEPENIMILNNYGYYLALREEKLEKAEKMSKKTITAEPENPTYLDTYAWILFKSGKLDEARDYMMKAMENGGDNDPDILEHYGDILQKIGNHEEALKYWLKAKENGAESEELEKKLTK
jgi:tetratricopeptide (TPR) repeat protein